MLVLINVWCEFVQNCFKIIIFYKCKKKFKSLDLVVQIYITVSMMYFNLSFTNNLFKFSKNLKSQFKNIEKDKLIICFFFVAKKKEDKLIICESF